MLRFIFNYGTIMQIIYNELKIETVVICSIDHSKKDCGTIACMKRIRKYLMRWATNPKIDKTRFTITEL